MKTVLIGCKLPHGIVLKGSQGQNIKLNGMNTALIDGGYGLTHVEEGEAAFIFATHAEFKPVESGAIFTHHTESVEDIIAVAAEREGEKTGFEGLDPATPVPGLKAEDNQSLNDEKLKAKPAVRAPASKADKAAAVKLATTKGGK